MRESHDRINLGERGQHTAPIRGRMITSFIVHYVGSEAGNRFLGRLPETATIRLIGLPVRNAPNGIPRP